MNDHTTRVTAQPKFDLDAWKQLNKTPGHKLIERGAKSDDPKVKEVVGSENGFLGSIHADEKLRGIGMKDVVDDSRGRYKRALSALPEDVREPIGARDVDKVVESLEGTFRKAMQPSLHTPGWSG